MSQDNPLEFKGGSLQTINALLRSTDPQALAAALQAMSGGATDFFGGEPLILDLSQAAELPSAIDWPAILELLRRYQLQPLAIRGHAAHGLDPAVVGIAGIDEHFFGRARATAAAAPVPAVQPAPPPEAQATEPAEPVQAELGLDAEPPRTLFVDKPLRSGQRVYARGGDLVVLAMVSAGAEVIADGNIHVYAPLRGRALAGAAGDHGARILTTCLQAELVSIAGIYRTFEQGLPPALLGQPATIALVEEPGGPTLRLEPLAIR